MIPVFNGATTIAAQLEALARQDTDIAFEVVVADNNSTDDTARVVAHVAAEVGADVPIRRVAAPTQGSNAARNAGVRATDAPKLLFCDADDVAEPGWVGHMAKLLEDHDAVSGALDPFTPDGGVLPPAPTGSVRPPRPPSLDFLPLVLGANCAVRRDVWEAVGGFDESYSAGGDDVEFFWRVQLAGYSLVVDTVPLMAYRLPSSLGEAVRKGFRKGRVSARLYEEFRPRGARFRPWRAVGSWAGLLYRAPALVRGRDARGNWLIRAGQCSGRLVGGLRRGLWYF